MLDPAELWRDLDRDRPAAARLAVISSLPVRVSPPFLRCARLRLLKDCTTGNEADLWLSDLVEARSAAGFSFRPEVRAFLRERLASDPALLDRVWREVHLDQGHWLSEKARLEEELTWRLLRDRNDPWIEASWRGIRRELGGPNPEGVARWVVRAVRDLPPGALESDLASKVWLAAHLCLGWVDILGEEPQRFLETGEFQDVTRRLPRRRIQVGLTRRGLIVSPVREIRNGHELDVPETRPLWIQVEDEEGKALQVVTLRGNEPVRRDIGDSLLILRLIDGSAFRLAEPSRPSSAGKFRGRQRAQRVQLEYEVELYGARKNIQLPFVMGVMADLSGNPAEALPPVADRKFIEVDIDNFDDRLISATKPRVAFQVPDTVKGEGELSVDITFERMDDFSPAAVARKVGALDRLLTTRQQLANLLTYMDGNIRAEELISKVLADPALLQALAAGPKPRADAASNEPESEGIGPTAETEARTRAAAAAVAIKASELGALLEKELGPKSERDEGAIANAIQTLAEQALTNRAVLSADVVLTIEGIIAQIDSKLTTQINPILHHEDFQKLEGAWRGLYHLVNNTETNEMLKIRVMNISKKDLHKTLIEFQGPTWDQSPVFTKLYEEEYGQFGGEPYGCFVGDYQFDHSRLDVELLGEISKIAAASHAPFIAGASPTVMQMDSWQELANPRDLAKIFAIPEYAAWRSLRESEDARYLGLTMPRFLARLPYGARTVPVEEFDFEEDTEGAQHNKYTWANSAYTMAVNINRAFKLYAWCARIRGVESGGAVEGLPVHTFPTDDGGVDMKCPTEIAISDRREAELAQNGFMALVHRKNSDFAVFIGAQSLQKPLEYDDPDATANANLAARLPYLFATCRFAHYLKCIVRDKIGSFMEREDMERYLNAWVLDYVDGSPTTSTEVEKARRPLAAAEVRVEDVEGNPGYYFAKFYLRPHYQLEGLTVSLRLVTRLPSAYSPPPEPP